MPLDPQIQAMIEAPASASARRLHELTPVEARVVYRERYRSRSLPPAPNVRITSLDIPGPDGVIKARLYRPAAVPERHCLPLVVYFHGGGFVLGDADAYEPQSTVLADRSQCMILFPEFRLAPEFPFPAAVDDAVATIRWVAANVALLQADPSRLGVAGDSAGGNLAANVCIAARDGGGPALRLQCLLYPGLDFSDRAATGIYPSVDLFSEGYWLDRSTRAWFRAQYLPRAIDLADPRASPLLARDLSRLPPAVVITAEYDPLRDVGKAFFDRLAAAGTSAEYRCVAGMVHNFLGHSAMSAAAKRALEDVGDLLRERLHD